MDALDQAIVASLPAVPRFLVRRIGRKYVAGERLEDALDAVRDLEAGGALATVDVLGEGVRDPGRVDEAVQEYVRLSRELASLSTDHTLSVKPSLMGLALGEGVALEAMDRVFSAAAGDGLLVQIDMEDHATTDATLRLYREMHERHGNAGAVLQARLRRTALDIEAIAEPGAAIRLCKGIYAEPEDVAWTDPDDIRASYVEGLEALLRAGAYAGVATHDEALVDAALYLVERLGIPRGGYEFQMLLGVRPALRRRLVDGGHRVRVYVPYGTDWEAYSLRRLRENPEIAMHVVRALVSGS